MSLFSQVRIVADDEMEGDALLLNAKSKRDVFRRRGNLAEVVKTVEGFVSIITSKPLAD